MWACFVVCREKGKGGGKKGSGKRRERKRVAEKGKREERENKEVATTRFGWLVCFLGLV